MTTAAKRSILVVAVGVLVAGGVLVGDLIARHSTASARGTSTTTTASRSAPTSKPLPTITLFLDGGHTPTWTGIKPSLIGFSGDGNNIVTDLRWQWGPSTAVGHGVWGYNNCRPYCDAGTITDDPATITLLDPAGAQFTSLLEQTYGPHGFTESSSLPAKAGAPWTTGSSPTSTTTTPTTSPVSVSPGDYLYVAENGEDTAMLALSQSAFGLTGTWYETSAHADSEAIALNGTETSIPPSNSFPVTVTRWSGGLQFEIQTQYATVTLRASSTARGFMATELVNGTPEQLSFSREASAAAYNYEAQQIANYCQSASADCGQN